MFNKRNIVSLLIGLMCLGFSDNSDAQIEPPSYQSLPRSVKIGGLNEISGSKNGIIDILEVKNMDIREALNIIAEKSGLLIDTDVDVEGQITIYLKNVDARDALRIILDVNELAFEEKNNQINVMTDETYTIKHGHSFRDKIQTRIIPLSYAKASNIISLLNRMRGKDGRIIFNDLDNSLVLIDSPESLLKMEALIKELDVPIEIEVFPLQYKSVDEVVGKVKDMLTESVGKIQVDEETNSLIVTDTAVRMNDIVNLILKVDRPPKKFNIKSKVLQITLNEEHQSGVDWEAIVSEYKSLEFRGFTKANNVRELTNLSLGIVSPEDYKVLLEALDTVGSNKTIADVQMLANEYEQSGVVVKSSEISGTLDPQKSLQEDLIIKFFPEFDENDFINLKLIPTILNDSNTQKEMNNEILKLKEGFTVIAGGIFKDVRIESTRKIPILGDLPFLGFAFRREGQLMQKSEVIIFITIETLKEEQGEQESL